MSILPIESSFSSLSFILFFTTITIKEYRISIFCILYLFYLCYPSLLFLSSLLYTYEKGNTTNKMAREIITISNSKGKYKSRSRELKVKVKVKVKAKSKYRADVYEIDYEQVGSFIYR